MGHFFQVQDDYLDCFGDPAVTGKIGTDIEDNKCGWLINQALLRCSEEQKKVLEENYAKKDPASVCWSLLLCVSRRLIFHSKELESLFFLLLIVVFIFGNMSTFSGYSILYTCWLPHCIFCLI